MNILKMRREEGSGFTIIEVIIASIILAIVVTGIAAFFMHIIKISDQMEDQSRAIEICREGIETLRTADVVSMDDGWQSPPFTVEGFTRSIWVDTPYPEYPEAKQVKCRVTWTGVAGADSVSLNTIL